MQRFAHGVIFLFYGYLNLEHAGPLVAVRVSADRAVERLAATKGDNGAGPKPKDARPEFRLNHPRIPGKGAGRRPEGSLPLGLTTRSTETSNASSRARRAARA
jgi:hypothetical protein